VKTQAGRKNGATDAENRGASMNSVDKQGHWAVNSRNGAYAHNVLPWESLRCLAGFGPERGRYFIERDLVKPPEELLMKVFPQIEVSE
jgi:Centromere DNA-binding protein complex CBF3 subunit, domain 2